MKLSEETIEKLDEIHSAYLESIKEILVNEARKNNPYKVGDVIEDYYQIGKIKNVVINTNIDKRTYSISYRCERLTKKLKPFKNGEDTMIYGCNVKRQITN